jgi:hypothetical protein
MSDRITLTVPTDARLRGVATLVLGGIGSRLDLSYERMDELQLAVLSLLDAGGADHVTMEVDAQPAGLSVALGPLAVGSGADEALTNVLDRLVDSVESGRRDGQEWLTLRIVR